MTASEYQESNLRELEVERECPRMELVGVELKQDEKAVYVTVTVRDQEGKEYRFTSGCFYVFLQKLPKE